MKVIHVIDSGGFYGAEVMLLHLCQAQQQLGLGVEVISIGTPGNYEKPLEKKLRAHDIPCTPWRMMALPNLRESYKIIRHAEAANAKVIHSHGYKGNILLGLLPKAHRKIPVITTIHGYTKQKSFGKMAVNQWLDRRCLGRLDAVVLVSEGMRHQVPADNIQHLCVVSNGIPEAVPNTANEPVPEFSSAPLKIGAIGRLSHEKNFSLLIRAMPYVLKAIPEAKLVIFGEGGERESLEQLVQELNLEQQVFLPGYIDEPARVFRQADVFVNSSLTEGMPITLLEALREGCPIVATDIPASRTLLSDLPTITQLVSFDPEALAAAITSLSAMSPEALSAGKQHAQMRFTTKHTATAMAKKYLSIYQQHARQKMDTRSCDL